MITQGVRRIKKPEVTQVKFESWTERGQHIPVSLVTITDGIVKSFRISKKVAEVLIARGMPHEG